MYGACFSTQVTLKNTVWNAGQLFIWGEKNSISKVYNVHEYNAISVYNKEWSYFKFHEIL